MFGYRCPKTDSRRGGAGPFCCCVGILVVMGICGIHFGDITNCGAGEPGRLDNFMSWFD